MSFWSVQTEEPLRQYRWYIIFGNASLANLRFALKKTDKPKAKINTVQHKYLNHFFNFPGRLEWEDINVTFAAVAKPNGSDALFKILTTSGYGVAKNAGQAQVATSGDDSLSSIGKIKMNNAIGTIDLVQIDPEGRPRETWQIYKPLFTNVQFGSLDYSSEEIVEISCTVKYDWAKLLPTQDQADPVTGKNPGFP